MYNFILQFHSGLRWLILVLAVAAIVKSIIGLTSGGAYAKTDKVLGAGFGWSMRIQFLIGLILYFISPVVAIALDDFGAAMKNDTLRFFAVEHITMMFLAVGASEVGVSKSKKAGDDKKKFKFQVIFFSLSLALILVAIPWDRLGN